MDIQGTAAVSSQVVTGSAGAQLESAAAEERVAEDSTIERREAEPSSTGPGVGEQVDVEA